MNACVYGSSSHLHLDPEHRGLPRQPHDVVIAEPEVSSNGSKPIFVLLPVSVEGQESDVAPLDQRPASPVGLHVTEDLQ